MWTVTLHSARIEPRGNAYDDVGQADEIAYDVGNNALHGDRSGRFFLEPTSSGIPLHAHTGDRRRASLWPHVPPRPADAGQPTNRSRRRRWIDWPLLLFWLVYLALVAGVVWMLVR